jgi:hypothetical protein
MPRGMEEIDGASTLQHWGLSSEHYVHKHRYLYCAAGNQWRNICCVADTERASGQ